GGGGDGRAGDGVGRGARVWVQYWRLRRRRCLRFAARLDLVPGRAARLPDRHPPTTAIRSVAGVTTLRSVYVVVVLLGLAAILVDHLSGPSSGRAVSPEDFAGACAPCGAPCPSKK